MRTDSLNLGELALRAAKQYIIKEFGDKYYQSKKYQTKSKDAQEAHEAIRPTNFKIEKPTNSDIQANKLYGLIRQRALASQMKPAQTDKTNIAIAIEGSDEKFLISGQILKFDGFLKITKDALNDVILPEMELNQELELLEARVFEKFSSPPTRFGEASLVKKLEELGIGRPSTYVPTIGTILERGYVIKGDVEAQTRRYRGIILQKAQISDYDSEEKWGGATGKLLPTDLAKLVSPFLKKHFGEIMDYGFTSKIETDFDKIARGKLDWTQHLRKFYDDFHPLVEAAQDIPRSEVGGMRELGKDPSDQKTIYARLGRYGPMLQKGLAEDSDDKPIFAPLPPQTTLEDVTLTAALKMFELPRLVGQTEGKEEIWAKIGRYGPYLQVDKLFIPIKDDDPFTIDEDRALELIRIKQEEDKKKIIAEFDKIKIINGRFGPYVTDGTKNGKIPKKDENGREIDLKKVTLSQAEEWLRQSPKKAKKTKK